MICNKMTCNKIDITKYVKKFDAYPSDVLDFMTRNNQRLPALTSLVGQAYALMSQPEVRGKFYIERDDASVFFKSIGLETADSIQPFNKSNVALKKMDIKKGQYCLEYPYVLNTIDIDKRKGCTMNENRDDYINKVKKWWNDNLVNVSNDKWQLGHLDPTIPIGSSTNLAYQPPLQAKYRNRFKWDGLFHKMWPTGDEWITNMNEYHTEDEQKKMLVALKAKFERV